MRDQNVAELDDLDKSIVGALQQNGRASNVEIGRALGVSEKTVRSRIARLTSDRGLRISAVLDEPIAAVQMLYLIDAEPGRRFHLAEELAMHPSVNNVLLANGAADLIVGASFSDADNALKFLVNTIEGSADVRSSTDCTIISRIGADETAMHSDARVPEIDSDVLLEATLHPPAFSHLNEILEWMCHTAARAFGADHALSLIYAPERTPEIPASPRVLGAGTFGFSPTYLDRISERLKSGTNVGVIRRCLETRQHVYVDDARTSPLMKGAEDVIRSEGYISMLAVPVLFGSIPFGVSTIYFDRPTTIDEHYVATIQRFIDQCAFAIARVEEGVTEYLLGGRLEN
ncbi:DNA-binding Lrp family transcriptional regulator [Antricoccus suffuscus]|uniref:DNA-binding Lrp family transcriptional regulator n=1 Tax=Antricoccus suffuscus TaxID=1629062 RepID=A0A2T1A6S6_9ACTN|nr:AsnC family transcriptional regulator [Antricoccus suffuscus]PRZ44028.1 DNA-binding Lrp family transcriptional regulator [Antricoccus suffuscus]